MRASYPRASWSDAVILNRRNEPTRFRLIKADLVMFG